MLPDFASLIVSEEEAKEIMRIEVMDNQELIDEELQRVAKLQAEGHEVPVPDEK